MKKRFAVCWTFVGALALVLASCASANDLSFDRTGGDGADGAGDDDDDATGATSSGATSDGDGDSPSGAGSGTSTDTSALIELLLI